MIDGIDDPDLAGWTDAEVAAWDWYMATVTDLADQPKLSFADARLLIDAYSAWVEIFDPPRARYHIAFFRQQIARREFGG